MPLLGAHVDSADPLAAAEATGAEAIQFFLADPQGWKKPVEHEHAAALRETDLSIYIHAPYLVNVASTNNKIRIPSRKILAQHAEAAAGIGAAGLIVHGGHVTAKGPISTTCENSSDNAPSWITHRRDPPCAGTSRVATPTPSGEPHLATRRKSPLATRQSSARGVQASARRVQLVGDQFQFRDASVV